ncbi:MAG TPA: hypothetical protein VFD80_07330 [Flavobacteriaceae bacterium]|nr:hypothetical protein [Flavobacteriaceae bacterium]
MKKAVLHIIILSLLISCQMERKDNIKIKNLHNFKLESIDSIDRKLIINITDELDFYDPVQNEQKTLFLLKDLKIDKTKFDNLKLHFNMPNREDGNPEFEIPVNHFINSRKLYDDIRMREIMSLIMELDSIDNNHYFLGGLNADFAYFWLKEDAFEKAFSGINSLQVIKDYLDDCEKDSSESISVISKYQKKYSDSTNLDTKLISKLKKYCKINSDQHQ